MLERAQLPAYRLELEVNESVLLPNVEQALATLSDLRRLGVRLTMDDFGTGHASLAYLLRFDFDKIKIDRSFITGLGTQPQSEVIVRSILRLGHSLGIEVCAEGVENVAQLAFLRSEGCDEVQGFLLGHAVPPQELDEPIRAGGWHDRLSTLRRLSAAPLAPRGGTIISR
jgi:EAL domain-containing protein (putative c-di-GMP-specific phosphodiesterase class I)